MTIFEKLVDFNQNKSEDLKLNFKNFLADRMNEADDKVRMVNDFKANELPKYRQSFDTFVDSKIAAGVKTRNFVQSRVDKKKQDFFRTTNDVKNRATVDLTELKNNFHEFTGNKYNQAKNYAKNEVNDYTTRQSYLSDQGIYMQPTGSSLNPYKQQMKDSGFLGNVAQFFLTDSDEMMEVHRKIQNLEPLTPQEVNMANEKSLDLFLGFSNVKSKGATGSKDIIEEGLETGFQKLQNSKLGQYSDETLKKFQRLAPTVKDKMDYLLAGKNKLVKSGFTPEQADKISFDSYKKILGNQANTKNLTAGMKTIKDPFNYGDDIVGAVKKSDLATRVNIIDRFLRTPVNVLKKIGLEEQAKTLRKQYNRYLYKLPIELEKITQWSQRIEPEAKEMLFDYLDGKRVTLLPEEEIVANEIRDYLKQWASRLGLPEEKQISKYIPHIFKDSLDAKVFDEELASLLVKQDNIPGSVYNPFLQKRQNIPGQLIKDPFHVLDVYVKRATRQEAMNPALKAINEASEQLEASQYTYIKDYLNRINMRPTDVDSSIDNLVFNVAGGRFGSRPTARLTRRARQAIYRGTIGLNPVTAMKNLMQGTNTYAELGEKYTTIGYLKAFQDMPNLLRGKSFLNKLPLFADDMVDRNPSAIKTATKQMDNVLFGMFEAVEKLNRASAYYGAYERAISNGATKKEAVNAGLEMARKTQFTFGSVDTPVGLQSDISKVFSQFLTYSIKQGEYLAGKVKNKEWAGLARYLGANAVLIYAFGDLLGLDYSDMIPTARFGVPPTLQIPVGVAQIAQTQDQYGNELTMQERLTNRNLNRGATNLIPGGATIRRGVEGLNAYNNAGSYTKSDRLRYPIDQNPGSLLRSAVFGQYSTPEARLYFENNTKPLGEKQTALYRDLVASGIEPKVAYDSIVNASKRNTQVEPPTLWERAMNFMGLTATDQPGIETPELDPLMTAMKTEQELSDTNTFIRDLFKQDLTKAEIETALEAKGITYEDASIRLAKAMTVSNGVRPTYIRGMLQNMSADKRQEQVIWMVENGIFTNAVVDYYEQTGVISEDEADRYKDFIKLVKDPSKATKSSGRAKSFKLPALPKVNSTVHLGTVPNVGTVKLPNVPQTQSTQTRPPQMPQLQQHAQLQDYKVDEQLGLRIPR